MAAARTHRPTWAPALGAIAVVSALLALLITAFGWPSSRIEPRDLPIAVAAPAPAVAQIEDGLAQAGAGAFAVTTVADRDAALQAIEDRDVYGAVVVDADGAEVLTASAASPAVAQLLTQLASGLAGEGVAAPVTDVVPTPVDDPRGSGFASGALPLVIGGVAAAALLSRRVVGRAPLLTGAVGIAVVGAMTMTAIWQYWLGSLEGDYWANASVVALALGATTLTVLGLHRLLGDAGLGLGAATMVLLGNPLSAMSSAPELLPSGWSDLGQLLPPGAAGSALRSVAFFDGAAAAAPLLVLAGWLALGLALCLLPSRRPAVQHAAEPEAVKAVA
ncbi:MAG: hypothetical protein GEU96_03585 [Propionibacteriales bacterium]|nr:hypothetical protein [Propionibacteriales bacterium]